MHIRSKKNRFIRVRLTAPLYTQTQLRRLLRTVGSRERKQCTFYNYNTVFLVYIWKSKARQEPHTLEDYSCETCELYINSTDNTRQDLDARPAHVTPPPATTKSSS